MLLFRLPSAESDPSGQRSSGVCGVIDSGLRLVEAGLAKCDHPYIAFSGGKDALVVAHMVHAVAPDTQMIYSDDELILLEHNDYINRVKAREGDRLMIVSTQAQHNGWFYPWFDPPFWHDPHPAMQWIGGNIDVRAKSMGYDGVFRGLRAQESRGRAIRLSKTQGIGQRRGITTIDPIRDWTVEQVWDYIEAHNLDYCPVYDRLSSLRVPRRLQRVGPLPLMPGDYLLRGWPELYAAVLQRYGIHWTRPGRRNRYGIPPLIWLDIQEALAQCS